MSDLDEENEQLLKQIKINLIAALIDHAGQRLEPIPSLSDAVADTVKTKLDPSIDSILKKVEEHLQKIQGDGEQTLTDVRSHSNDNRNKLAEIEESFKKLVATAQTVDAIKQDLETALKTLTDIRSHVDNNKTCFGNLADALEKLKQEANVVSTIKDAVQQLVDRGSGDSAQTTDFAAQFSALNTQNTYLYQKVEEALSALPAPNQKYEIQLRPADLETLVTSIGEKLQPLQLPESPPPALPNGNEGQGASSRAPITERSKQPDSLNEAITGGDRVMDSGATKKAVDGGDKSSRDRPKSSLAEHLKKPIGLTGGLTVHQIIAVIIISIVTHLIAILIFPPQTPASSASNTDVSASAAASDESGASESGASSNAS